MQTTSSRTVTGPNSKALLQVFSRYFLKYSIKLHSTRTTFYNWYNISSCLIRDLSIWSLAARTPSMTPSQRPQIQPEQLLTVWTLKIRVYPPVHHPPCKTNRTTGRYGHTQSSLGQCYWLKGRRRCTHKECYRHGYKLKRFRHRYWREQTSTETRKRRGTAKQR